MCQSVSPATGLILAPGTYNSRPNTVIESLAGVESLLDYKLDHVLGSDPVLVTEGPLLVTSPHWLPAVPG